MKIVILPLLFLCGIPLNAMAGFHLGNSALAMCAGPTNQEKMDMHTLKQHLNISDLAILGIYALSELIWCITYEWHGGSLACKLVAFLRLASFNLSSFIVVAIALNRLFSITNNAHFFHSARRVRIMAATSWFLALSLAVPQLFVWETVKPFPGLDWKQCTTIWEAKRGIQNPLRNSDTQLYSISVETSNDTMDISLHEQIYNLYHVVTVFYLPLLIIIVSYIVLIHRISCYGKLVAKRDSADLLELQRQHTNGPDPTTSDTSTYINMRKLVMKESVESAKMKCAKKRTIRASALITLSYLVCWSPYQILQAIKIFNAPWYETHAQQAQHLNVLIIFNAVSNPFLYGMFGTLKSLIING